MFIINIYKNLLISYTSSSLHTQGKQDEKH